MFVINGIVEDTANKEALIICNGEKYRITLHDFQVLDFREGDSFDEEQYNLLFEAHQRLACIKKSFHFLSYGDMSARKLSQKLRPLFPADIARDVIQLLRERRYIDDLVLIQRYITEYYEIRRYGPVRIRAELFKRGFDNEDINQAIEPIESFNHTENILYLAEMKFGPGFREDMDLKQRQRVYTYLYRMGYNYDDIKNSFSSLE